MISRGRWIVVALGCALSAGCQDSRGPVSIHSDDPDLKIIAIRQEATQGDKQHVALMVDDLSNEDSAIRFYSIEALKRLSHEDFGYLYYAPEEQRAPAIAKWREWLKRQGK